MRVLLRHVWLLRRRFAALPGLSITALASGARAGFGSIAPLTEGRGSYFFAAFLAFKDAFPAFATEWFLLWRATAFAISSEESLLWFSECKTSVSGLGFVAML